MRGFFGIGGIAFEEASIGFKMGTAASGVRDDGVEILQIERIDQSARKVTCSFQFAIVVMERAATNLHLRRVDFAAIGQKDIHRIAVHI